MAVAIGNVAIGQNNKDWAMMLIVKHKFPYFTFGDKYKIPPICPDCQQEAKWVDSCREYLFKIPVLPTEIVIRNWGAKEIWCEQCYLEKCSDDNREAADRYNSAYREGYLDGKRDCE